MKSHWNRKLLLFNAVRVLPFSFTDDSWFPLLHGVIAVSLTVSQVKLRRFVLHVEKPPPYKITSCRADPLQPFKHKSPFRRKQPSQQADCMESRICVTRTNEFSTVPCVLLLAIWGPVSHGPTHVYRGMWPALGHPLQLERGEAGWFKSSDLHFVHLLSELKSLDFVLGGLQRHRFPSVAPQPRLLSVPLSSGRLDMEIRNNRHKRNS